MAGLDYMKVIEIISDIFDADYKVNLKATKDLEFEVETPMSNGSLLRYKMRAQKYDIAIQFEKEQLNSKNAHKIVPELEYQLEQTFLKNIKVDFIDERTKSLLNISM